MIAATTMVAVPVSAGAAVVDLVCPATTATIGFAPPLTLTPRTTTVTISSGVANLCLDTSGQTPAVQSGTFTGQLTTTMSCVTAGNTPGTATFSWNLADGTHANSSSSVSLTADVAGEIVVTGTVTGGRFAGATLLGVFDVTSTNALNLCLLGQGVSTAALRGPLTFAGS
ncbi:hypothetical protein AOZ06_15965 [Kibdelosporangium phytohabitans]|uniref:Ig-like domain-containing protein n=1 Tax=Kibdelosporangium phytohabitans TaxID=860235 RepID=A0A0N9HY27_9PSEU|nr:hypothetical protein [Kibdelosporangium phytohabitans]ALG08205.1 hypothetical protein AOZ06_15965 [Kibdelosporangium phytohabitans]